MKEAIRLMALTVVVVLVVAAPAAYSQANPGGPAPGGPGIAQPGQPGQNPPTGPAGQTPAPGPAPTGPAGQTAPADRTFNGQLAKVDATAKTISVKGADDKEMMFTYNEDTQVISPEKTVQALTGKTGADLKVSYREERGSNRATRIEVIEKN